MGTLVLGFKGDQQRQLLQRFLFAIKKKWVNMKGHNATGEEELAALDCLGENLP